VASADALAWCGAIAGWAAPLTIGAFVVAGGRRRRSYDPWRDTMTELGDGVDGVATAFVIVNLAVAALLGVVAGAAQYTLHSWPLTIALIVAAAGSVVFGLTACELRCKYPLCAGEAPGWLPRLHVLVAVVVALEIVLAPFLTWFALRDRANDFTAIRVVSLLLGAAALVLAGVFRQQMAAKRRADGAERASSAVPGLFERLLWIVGYAWVVVLACTLVRPGWPSMLAMGLWLVLALWFVLLPDWRDPSLEFSIDECQPGTLTPLRKASSGKFRVCTIDSPGAFRDELRRALEQGVLGGTTEGAASAVTLAVTARGLHTLGVPYGWHARFVEDAFAEGMLSRAARLGDMGPSDPANWDAGWRDPDRLHVAFWILGRTRSDVDALDQTVRKCFQSVTDRVRVPTDRLSGPGGMSREPFGFVDGVSQPWIDGVPIWDARNPRAGGKLVHGTWKPLALGEFVVGQADETGDIFPVPTPPEVFLGGTFLVVRQLQQDLAGFHDFAGDDTGRGSLAARLVGRTHDGDPLEQSASTAKDRDRNDFRYGADPEGLRCPLGAHIRRTNPRDALGFGTTLSARRRIVRRGMPYDLSSGTGDPGDDRGLLFIACNLRIAEQFEFIQAQWLNDGSPFGLGNIPDPIGGVWDRGSPRPIVVAGRPPEVIAELPSLVTTKGGEYFFVPSVPGLRALADSGQGRVEAGEQLDATRGDADVTMVLG
jgi:Dyp-type peroxidase family